MPTVRRFEFVQFLTISNGSGNELQSQLYRCLDKGYFDMKKFEELYELADKTCRKICCMMRYLNQSSSRGQKFKDRVLNKKPVKS